MDHLGSNDDVLIAALVAMGFDIFNAKRAIQATNRSGLDAAVDWILRQTDDSTPSAPLIAQTSPTSSDRVLRLPFPNPTSTAPPFPPTDSMHIDSPNPNTIATSPPSEDESTIHSRYKESRSELERVAQQRYIEQAKKYKRDDRDAKARALEQIREDREKVKARSRQQLQQQQQQSSSSVSPSAPPASTQKHANDNPVTIQVRLPTGKVIRTSFPPSALICDVAAFVKSQWADHLNFHLLQPFPRTVYDDETVSLIDAGLGRGGSLSIMVVQPPAPPVAPVEENVPEIPSHQPETVNSSPFDDMDVDNDNQNDDHPMDRDDQSEHSDEGDESENDGVAGLTIGSTIAPSSPSRSPSREERAAIMARIILSRQQQSEPSQPADPTPGPSATSPSAENRTGDVRSAMLAAATSRQQSALTSSPQTLSASTKTKTRTMLRSLRDVCLRVCASIVFNPATPRAAVSRLPHLGSHLTEQLMQALMSTRQLERMSLLRLSTCTIERVVWDAYVLATDSLLQTLATSQWKNVRKLSLKACSFVTDAGVGECVESLKYLEILDLSGCRLTDLVAFPISSITKLEYLNLSGTKVTAAGVGIIGSSQTIAASLCELYLSQCEHISGDRVLAALAPLRNLQILQLSSTKLTSPQRLPPRTQDDSLFPSLRRLDLSRTQLRDEDLSRTLGPKLHGEQLEELDLRGCNLCGMEGVSAVVTGKFSSLNCIVFPNKEHLDIDGVLARMAGAECADGEKLKMVRMELEGFAMLTDAGLEWMRVVGFESLSFLSLGGTKIGDAGLRAVGACTELRELYLDRTAVTDEGMAFLKDLRQLEVLSLANTRITDLALLTLVPDALFRSMLKKLNLCRCREITDEGIVPLATLVNLSWLNLDFTGVTPACLNLLQGLHSLGPVRLVGLAVQEVAGNDAADTMG